MNGLKKIFLSYEAYDGKKRSIAIYDTALIVSCISVITMPFSVYISHKINNADDFGRHWEKYLFSVSLMNTTIINALWSSLLSFFVLQKLLQEKKLISPLSTKDIALISFITFPVLAIIFSCIAGSVIYNVRKDMNGRYSEDMIYNEAFCDSLFLNPIGLVSGALVVTFGTIYDNCIVPD